MFAKLCASSDATAAETHTARRPKFVGTPFNKKSRVSGVATNEEKAGHRVIACDTVSCTYIR